MVDKPTGPTSHRVVEEVRSNPLFVGAKVGHTGTLDPFASGLLLLVVGHATRYQSLLTDMPKTYDVTAQFGARSSTGDTEGEIEKSGLLVTADKIRSSLERFVGEIEQRIPATSAVKVDGERLYKRAHRGETVDTPTRTVYVECVELEDFDSEQQVCRLRVSCGKGAYMRQLVADIGEATGSGAYCNALRRTSIGDFSVNDALTLERFEEEAGLHELRAWMPLEVSLGSVRIA